MTWSSGLVVLGLVAAASAGIFDFTEFDDPFTAIAQITRNGVSRSTLGGECRGSLGGSQRYGVCRAPLDCRVAGGDPAGRGSCLSLQHCCIYEGLCNSVSSKKVSYFASPVDVPEDLCTFTVKVSSRSVCQMRIDFEEFTLAEPTQESTSADFTCREDWLKITTPNGFVAPTVCGQNDGQHMYIPVNASVNEDSIKLSIRLLESRTTQPTPHWRLRITQLECPTVYNSKAAAWSVGTYARDFPALAPTGCLQYFTDRRGTVTSFAWQRGRALSDQHYIANHDYSICFRRTGDTCGLRVIPVQFRLADKGNIATDSCVDYIFIPETTVTGDPNSPPAFYKYCGSDMSPTSELTALVPSPLYMHFHSGNGKPMSVGTTNGFELNWEIVNC